MRVWRGGGADWWGGSKETILSNLPNLTHSPNPVASLVQPGESSGVFKENWVTVRLQRAYSQNSPAFNDKAAGCLSPDLVIFPVVLKW